MQEKRTHFSVWFFSSKSHKRDKKASFFKAPKPSKHKKWSPHPSFFTRNKRLQNFFEVIFDTKKILGQKRPQIFSNAHNPKRRKRNSHSKTQWQSLMKILHQIYKAQTAPTSPPAKWTPKEKHLNKPEETTVTKQQRGFIRPFAARSYYTLIYTYYIYAH